MITVFGAGLGPPDGVAYSLTVQGTVPTVLGNTTLTFDGNVAPLIFVRADQINAIVPYEIAGRPLTNVVVSSNGIASPPLPQVLVDTAPAIFSKGQGGNGQGAILNANSTVNTPENPATRGSVIQIFATGEGLYPGATTGSVSPAQPPFPKPAADVSLTIGGERATIQYAGEAPGLPSGILQVNAVVPENIGSGPQIIVLTVGNNSNSLQSVTVAVQ